MVVVRDKNEAIYSASSYEAFVEGFSHCVPLEGGATVKCNIWW